MVSQARIVTPTPDDILVGDSAPAPEGSPSEITTVVIDDGGGRKASGGDSAPRARRTTARAKRPSLEKELTETFAFIGLSVSLLNFTDGQIIMDGTPRLAAAWNNAAQRSENVHKALTTLTGSLGWAEIIGATLSVAVPIFANHGLLPIGMAQAFGVALEPKQEKREEEPSGYATGVYSAESPEGESADSYAERAAVG